MRMVEGIIVDVKPGKMQAKVRLDAHCDSDGNAMVTDWLQIGFTGPDMHYSYRKDDYVGCIMDDTLDDGWIICRLYKESENLNSTEQKSVFKFKEGVEVEVEEKPLPKVTIKIGETTIISDGSSVEIKAAGQLTFPVVHANSPCPVFGGCHINPSNTVKVSL
jgi:hypothetical protein